MRNKDDFCLGFFAEGQLAGKLCFNRERRRRTRHRGNIWGFYVSRPWRGEGMGRTLLETALERIDGLPGMEQVKLVVVQGNETASTLYARSGFESAYREERAYRLADGSYLDLLHMTRYCRSSI
ncbi:MAG: GNAT family N-acetyltransferase [Spirochaetales bacterium]|nr:GNAT family N-acetyltransferase [Spirochaetales bacterium]